MNITAQATTGINGQRLRFGFDPSCIQPAVAGDRAIDPWEREVTFKTTETLSEVLDPNTPRTVLYKFNMLALSVRDAGVPMDTEVSLFASGHIIEIRTNTRKQRIFRAVGNKLLGERK